MHNAVTNIHHEMEAVIRKTHTIVSWKEMAQHIADGAKCVQCIMGTNEFRHSVTKVPPQCNGEQLRKWRRNWATEFHIFWKVSNLTRKTVQLLLFCIYEKWFLVLVLRKYGNIVPEYGCQGAWNRVYYKMNIDKLLVIRASAIVPFINGTGHKICMTRASENVSAKQDS